MLVEALGWMAVVVEEFGVAALDVRKVVEWCLADLGSRDAAVRTAATCVLAAAHRQVTAHRPPRCPTVPVRAGF